MSAFNEGLGALLGQDLIAETVKAGRLDTQGVNEDLGLLQLPPTLDASQIMEEVRHVLSAWEGRGGPVAVNNLIALSRRIVKEMEAGSKSEKETTTSSTSSTSTSTDTTSSTCEATAGNKVVISVWRGLAHVVRKPKGIEVAILDYDVQDAEGEEQLKQAEEIAKTCDVVVAVRKGVADVEKKPNGVEVEIRDKD